MAVPDILVFGKAEENALRQMATCAVRAKSAALMADHHLGYSQPVGGVIAYEGLVSPSGVGYDIACGNKAVLTDAKLADLKGSALERLADDIVRTVSFGIGQRNPDEARLGYFAPLEAHEAWTIPNVAALKGLARDQLGTVGSGNHFVDLFADEQGRIWVGVHFGSRGLGHKIASHYMKAGGGVAGIHTAPVLLAADGELGAEYLAAMDLAGGYAYAGRDYVCQVVVDLLGARALDEVHNHHNYAWLEDHDGRVFVVRKGATPAFPGQRCFVGSSMGEESVILRGVDSDLSRRAMYSTVHGAGRVMSRTQAAGKFKGWGAKRRRLSQGAVSEQMMRQWLSEAGVLLRGGGVDESPHVYKRLDEVLAAHAGTIEVEHRLRPLVVVMAGAGEFDPYQD